MGNCSAICSLKHVLHRHGLTGCSCSKIDTFNLNLGLQLITWTKKNPSGGRFNGQIRQRLCDHNDRRYVWRSKDSKNTVTTVKDGSGRNMLWGCFVAGWNWSIAQSG